MAFLDERNIGGGFRTSRNRLTVAESGPLFIGWDGYGFTLRYSVRGNRLSTYLRTPTPLSADVDPGFIIDFDLDVIVDINVKNNQLVAGPARIQADVKRPTGKNITGDLVVAANDLVATLAGTDFVGSLLQRVNGRPGFDGASGNATLTLLNVGPAPVVH